MVLEVTGNRADSLQLITSRDGIHPGNLGEAGEVAVCADHGEAMLDTDRSKYGVGDKSGSNVMSHEQRS